MTTPHFRFLCLGSGSSGNCFIYQTPQGSLMIDAGIGIRKLTAYLLQYDIPISSIKAIFLTHDHIDHIKSAASLAKKYSLPIYATKEVWHGIDSNPVIRHKVAGEFRRFLTTGKKNVRIELLFLALGFNLKKRWMKQQKRRLETHYSEKKVS